MPGVLQGMGGSWFALCEGVTAGSLMLLFAGFADLLNKDFHTDQKFTLTTYTSSGAVSISGFFTPSAVSCAIFCMLRLLVWLLFLRFLVFFRCGNVGCCVVLLIRTSRLGVSVFQALHCRVISVLGFARWMGFGLVRIHCKSKKIHNHEYARICG